MRFGWGRSGAAAIEASSGRSAEETPYELAAIELLTEDGCLVGWVATEGERTSDWLNHHAEVPIHELAPRDDGSVPQPPHLPADSARSLSRDRIIWAVPPPLPPNRHLRLHRRRMLVHLELDDYEISGQVHVRPGADAADHLIRGSRHMVPLTDVQVSSRRDPKQTTSVPVLIINRTHVRRIVAEQASPPAPAVPPVEVGETAATSSVPEAASALPTSEAIQAALATLLESEVIDVIEFQSIRARALRKAADGA